MTSERMEGGGVKRRALTAATAALATAGALAVPLIAAAPASAAEPTGLVVAAPTSAYTNAGGSHDFTVNLTPSTATADHAVMFAITSGPDANGLIGTACSGTGVGPYTCTVTNGGQAGVDQLTFFYDVPDTGTFQAGDPSATGTLTVGGSIASITLSPTAQHSAQGVYQAYQVSASDSAGRPVSDTAVSIEATQSNAVTANLAVTGTDPGTGANFGQAGPTANGNADVTGTATTGDGTGNSTPGKATIWVASQVAGTVNLTASTSPANAAISMKGSLTVDASGVNDVTSVTLTPNPQNAFAGKNVVETVTLKNAQGDPVAGIAPFSTSTGLTATVVGTNAGATVTVAGATNGLGQTTISYPTGSTAGSDTLTAWVNQSDNPTNSAALDAGEPSGNATINLAAENIGTLSGTDTTVPAGTTSAAVTFTLTDSNGGPRSGVELNFSVAPSANYTVSPTSAVTGADGTVTVTVTADSTGSAAGSTATVTATVALDTSKTATATASWQARTATNTVITPFASTNAVGGSSASYSVSTTDQFGAPVNGLKYTWSVSGRNNPANNAGATGTGTTFSYTDKGPALDPGQSGVDLVSVSATYADGTGAGGDTVDQYWVPGSAQAAQLNGDLSPYNGEYVQNGTNGPWVPTGFTKSETAGLTTTPAEGETASVVPVEVKLADANGNPLFGDKVSFTSSGAGGFTDSTGHPLANPSSTTALVCDWSGANGEDDDACWGYGAATVYVRSDSAGTERITATADNGRSDTVTVTYSGQYVAVNPERVADTRSGQGGIASYNSGAAPSGGRLAKNTLYEFDYYATDMPLDARAYAFNITAIGPSGQGNLRVAPICSEGGVGNSNVPSTSLINYQPGSKIAVANFAVEPNSECDGLKLYSDGATAAVAIDLVGYYSSSDAISNITPARVVDTRSGLNSPKNPVAAGTSRSFQIAGNAGIPVDAKAVALNVVAVHPTGVGNLRIYPDGNAVPNASSINYISGVDKAAFVIVNLPADGKIDVYSDGHPANVVIDAYAYYPTTANLVTQSPVRILDTRQTSELAADSPRNVQVGGQGGVPADAQAVLVSVTSIHAKNSTGVGNLRVYPAGQSLPTVSTLNYVSKTADVANFAIVKLGSNGQLTLYSDGSPINVALDVVGWVPAGAGQAPPV